MTVTVELRVLHLLCARLCHDLVGPVGAISNGIELVQEFGADMEKDAFDLIAGSAKRVAGELQFFRVAYGLAAGMATTVADARTLATPYIGSGRVKLDWPAQADDKTMVIGDNPVKLTLNMALLGVEALVRGGTLRVAVAMTPSPQITVVAAGEGAAPRRRDAQGHGRRRPGRRADPALGPGLFRGAPRRGGRRRAQMPGRHCQ